MGNTAFKSSKTIGFLLIVVVYILALVVGIKSYDLLYGYNFLVRLFVADAIATVFVWLFSVLFKNSSVYDPYWSVAPMVMITAYAFEQGAHAASISLLLLVIWFWGLRLTGNWAFTFKDLSTQDWRYDKYKNQFPSIWQLVNFFGIHFMPTLVVFLAMIPAFYLIGLNAQANVLTYLMTVLAIFAVALQAVADRQSRRFRRANPGKVCAIGLWKYMRHPNYLGEIMLWWLVYFMLITLDLTYWWTFIGALANTLMFVFISIPLMEKRQMVQKPAYRDYVNSTPMLLPISRDNFGD
ncbi:MAG: DUF1295 domain-containing protein [Bacteroidales bacterium]|nr:DUF1295 domain-containing protein [Bacteroidales bacterium]